MQERLCLHGPVVAQCALRDVCDVCDVLASAPACEALWCVSVYVYVTMRWECYKYTVLILLELFVTLCVFKTPGQEHGGPSSSAHLHGLECGTVHLMPFRSYFKSLLGFVCNLVITL